MTDRDIAHPFIVGVAGGTGGGKTTVSNQLRDTIGSDKIAYIQHDSYYRDISHLSPEERAARNYDHPNSLETELLVAHLTKLKAGQSVQVPIYDFEVHNRKAEYTCVHPSAIILVEGILIFAEPALRELMDLRIFVDTAADLRIIRRLQRDMTERGRTLESIVEQYLATVRPMHLEFVEPSKRHADFIMPADDHNPVAMEMIISRLKAVVVEVAEEQ